MNTNELKELELQELEEISGGQDNGATVIEELAIKIVTEFKKIFFYLYFRN